MGGFLDHFGVMLSSETVLDAPFVSDLDLDSSTHPILEDFGKLLRTVLDIFLYFFWIQVLK